MDIEPMLELCGFPPYEKEYRFHPTRKFRFDYAFPDKKLAIEIEGGIWIRGRHTRPIGYAKDCEKYNIAALMGWRVIRVTTGCDLESLLRAVHWAFFGGGE
jgi:very-short-patch-repair endonuclease